MCQYVYHLAGETDIFSEVSGATPHLVTSFYFKDSIDHPRQGKAHWGTRDQRQTLSRPQRAYRTRIMEGKAEEIVHLKKKINILSWISSSLKHCLPQDLTGSVTLIFVSMAPFQQLL